MLKHSVIRVAEAITALEAAVIDLQEILLLIEANGGNEA